MRFVCLWLILVASAWAREVRFTVLHTTDLHGEVDNLARCATLIGEVRGTEKHVLLVDNGDTIQGSAVSWLTGGEVMIRLLNALRYDAWVIGNHEFDWGLDKLTNCLARATMPVLAANAVGLPELKSFLLREVDGVKVALIGLTTPGIPNWSRPRLIPGLQFADSLETLRRVLPAARAAGAQVFVLVVHQGYKERGDDHANQVRAIAGRFPELDVIIGGHTHREFHGMRLGRSRYTQAGFHGRHLGRVDLVFDTEKRRLVSVRSRLLPVAENVPADQNVLALARNDLERARKYLATPLGEAAEDFLARGAPKQETPLQNLLCRAVAAALQERGVKVDAVVHGLLNARESLAKGPITIADVWRIVPYENTVGVAQLRLPQLREILDENAGAYEKPEFRGIWGLRWRFDPKRKEPPRTVELKRADGQEIGEPETLAVAFNSYELASGGLRWRKLREIADLPETRLMEYEIGTREAVIELIRRERTLTPRVDGWWEAVKPSRRKQD